MIIDYHLIILINHRIDTTSHKHSYTYAHKHKKSFHGKKIIPLLLLLAIAHSQNTSMSFCNNSNLVINFLRQNRRNLKYKRSLIQERLCTVQTIDILALIISAKYFISLKLSIKFMISFTAVSINLFLPQVKHKTK